MGFAPLLVVLGLLVPGSAQQAGTNKKEVHVPIRFAECTKSDGCKSRLVSLTMDAQWRWLHDARPNMYENCINDLTWDRKLAKDGASGAANCALEGMDAAAYKGTYGVSTIPGGVQLNFKNGESIGSRLYMMEDTDTYMMFNMLNKEFTLDVDVSTLECGLNGAVYFVEMEADGGLGKNGNQAGAKFGTGYCDAQCPHDLKFIDGEANVKGWHMTEVGPRGHYGSCCAEMDIWEANKMATTYTTHACTEAGLFKCQGESCGDTPSNCTCCSEAICHCCGRYKGVCDKDGCDFNHFRLGDEQFYGEGSAYTVDTSKPMTVVTQFLTSDNTDQGELVEIRRLYVQDGKVIKNSAAKNLDGAKGDSITDGLCSAQKKTFDNHDDFGPKGGLNGMGKALGRGMVLVLSLWDDALTQMAWLDSATPTDDPVRFPLDKPGVKRGPCAAGAGDPKKLRSQFPNAHVKFSNIMVGEIGSTYGEAAKKVRNLPETEEPAAGGPSGQPTVEPVVPVLEPGVTPTETGKGICCTAAKDPSNACGSCWPGSDDRVGWCADKQGNCETNCGGTWCPNGVISAFEVPSQDDLREVFAEPQTRSFNSTAFIAMPLLLAAFPAAALVRASLRRRQVVPPDELGLLVPPEAA